MTYLKQCTKYNRHTSIHGDTSTRDATHGQQESPSDLFTVNHRPRQRAHDRVDTIAAPAHAHTRARQLGRSHSGPITRTVADRQDAFANRTAYTPRSLSPTGWAFCIYAVNCLVAPCSLVFFPLRCNTSSAYCHTRVSPAITPATNHPYHPYTCPRPPLPRVTPFLAVPLDSPHRELSNDP